MLKFDKIVSNSTNLGMFYMLISAICMSLMGAFLKLLTHTLPTVELVFFRNFIGIALILATFFKYPLQQIGGKPYLLIFRGIAGFIAMLSFFYNVAHISLADAVTYSRTSPIFTAILAMIFLKEKIGKKGWIAIFLGFFGMILVMQPTLGLNKNHIFGLLNALFAAFAFTSIRELKNYYDTRIIVLSFMGMGVGVSLFLMLISNFFYISSLDFMLGYFIMPVGIDWLYIVLIGIFSSLSQIFMTKAYANTKAGIVGAIGYFVIIFSVIIGFIMGDNLPNFIGFLGMFCIIIGGFLNAKK